MRYISLIFIVAVITWSFSANAQDVSEAYNLSNLTVQGTARSMGFGNALGSVGGDFSSLSVNPAGIGIYRRSEMNITPSLYINGISSQYSGNTTTGNTTHFNFNNFSLVFTNAPKGRAYDRRNWKSVSFAFGMNRVADFNHDYNYSGINKTSSASQAFESDANLNQGNDTIAGTLGYLGYQSYLLNDSLGHFYSVVPFGQGVQQTRIVQERGGINEFVISFGGNYKEKLLLGITMGLPNINYQRNVTYTETYVGKGSNPYGFSSFQYSDALKISGTGINVKFGAIYKITEFIRIGAALHTPTFYNITDIYDQGIQSIVGGNYHELSSADYLPENQFSYTFTTPWKTVLSATYIFKKLGFITADYEYVNYNTMHYNYPTGIDNTTGSTFQAEQTALNNMISNTYKSVSNFRIGAEILLTKYFMVRGGLGYYADPYTGTSIDRNGQRIDLSCGVGFHFKHFYTDLGLVHSSYQHYEQPYSVDFAGVYSGASAAIPSAQVNYSINNAALTIGYKF